MITSTVLTIQKMAYLIDTNIWTAIIYRRFRSLVPIATIHSTKLVAQQ